MPEWTARVSHTVFRLLIVGAALARAYKEPLFKAWSTQTPRSKRSRAACHRLSHRLIV